MPQLGYACLGLWRHETVTLVVEVAEARAGFSTQLSKGRTDRTQADHHLVDALQLAVVQQVHRENF